MIIVIKTKVPRNNPKTISAYAQYSHTVWGVDINEQPLAAVNGRKHFNNVPILVYKRTTHAH